MAMKKEILEAMVDILVQECLAQRKQIEALEDGTRVDASTSEELARSYERDAVEARTQWKKWRGLAHRMAILWEGFKEAQDKKDPALWMALSKHARTILEDKEIAGIPENSLLLED